MRHLSEYRAEKTKKLKIRAKRLKTNKKINSSGPVSDQQESCKRKTEVQKKDSILPCEWPRGMY